ncbi:hypothetical protein TNIN_43541 [Trichonephila inaurata madagascariensis]|uniref:Uncharacterized protein n=1 Tax=Trichonephila inaurata madagascariensis TaxID=2747483 RepID=A0A8X6XVB2_9ARAC|nr:hypothetical protein TNIN_43541 [Trichonephila inaurata madagascariensis]
MKKSGSKQQEPKVCCAALFNTWNRSYQFFLFSEKISSGLHIFHLRLLPKPRLLAKEEGDKAAKCGLPLPQCSEWLATRGRLHDSSGILSECYVRGPHRPDFAWKLPVLFEHRELISVVECRSLAMLRSR